MKKRTAALHNLGCKVNAYETEAMQQLLENAGYEIVPFTQKADVYVINTCSVTNIADRKSRQMLHRAKKRNPQAVVVAAGCYVQTGEEQVRKDPAIDLIIGNNKKHELIPLLTEFFSRQEQQNSKEQADQEQSWRTDVTDLSRPTEYEQLAISRTSEHTRAFLKVQDGCNQFCTYCIIPYARGRVRSRAMKDVLREVRILAASGVKEIVLTGIHLDSYGTDTNETLLSLVSHVHEIAGIERIRLGSLEPSIMTEDFVAALAGLPKLCPHFHLSLQSGSDSVLRRMNRHYDTAQYRESCRLLRQYFLHPAITTDVIVGFPGETEEEFAQTRRFLDEIDFYEVHIFKYSRRKGTKADRMPDQVPEEQKAKRSEILFADHERRKERFCSWYLGRQAEVLLEEPVLLDGEPYFTGYTPEYVKVAVKTGEMAENRIVRGTIKEAGSSCMIMSLEF